MARGNGYAATAHRQQREAFTARVREAICRTRMKQREVASAMGWCDSQVALIVTNRRTIRTVDLVKFCRVVGCDVLWLLKGDEWDGQG